MILDSKQHLDIFAKKVLKESATLFEAHPNTSFIAAGENEEASIRVSDPQSRTMSGKVRSGDYQFTVVKGNAEDEKKLADLRTEVTKWNKENPGKQFRVTVEGRLGKNNPTAPQYKDKVGMPHIRKADSLRSDIYVQVKAPSSLPLRYWKDRNKNANK